MFKNIENMLNQPIEISDFDVSQEDIPEEIKSEILRQSEDSKESSKENSKHDEDSESKTEVIKTGRLSHSWSDRDNQNSITSEEQ